MKLYEVVRVREETMHISGRNDTFSPSSQVVKPLSREEQRKALAAQSRGTKRSKKSGEDTFQWMNVDEESDDEVHSRAEVAAVQVEVLDDDIHRNDTFGGPPCEHMDESGGNGGNGDRQGVGAGEGPT